MRKAKLAASVSAALLFTAGCGQQPENFDDCILKHMDGVTSDKAAVLISQSCLARFPEHGDGGRAGELTQAELSKLSGRVGPGAGSDYGGILYNGNPDITVTSVTMMITARSDDNATSREYKREVTIPPLSAGHFNVKILPGDQDAEYSSEITSARGYRK